MSNLQYLALLPRTKLRTKLCCRLLYITFMCMATSLMLPTYFTINLQWISTSKKVEHTWLLLMDIHFTAIIIIEAKLLNAGRAVEEMLKAAKPPLLRLIHGKSLEPICNIIIHHWNSLYTTGSIWKFDACR